MGRSVRHMVPIHVQGRPVMELVRIRKYGKPGFNNIVHLVPEGRPGLALCGTKTNVYDRAVEDIAGSSLTQCKRCEKQENKNETG